MSKKWTISLRMCEGRSDRFSMPVKRGSAAATDRIFSSGPLSSRIIRMPSGRAAIRQPGKVGWLVMTRMSSGSPSSASVSQTQP